MSSDDGHPSPADVLDAARGRGSTFARAHLERCVACQRLAALAALSGGPSGDTAAGSRKPDAPTASASDQQLTPSTILHDRFQIEQWVASGGMGAIYRAQDTVTGLAVAIKIATSRDPMALARFERESRLLAQLHHPGLVDYVAHSLAPGGIPYLVMSWLDGIDLASRLTRHGAQVVESTRRERRLSTSSVDQRPAGSRGPAREQLPIADVIHLGRRLASAVEAMHDRRVLHRDIKPANIFLVDHDVASAKLIDSWRRARGGRAPPADRDRHGRRDRLLHGTRAGPRGRGGAACRFVGAWLRALRVPDRRGGVRGAAAARRHDPRADRRASRCRDASARHAAWPRRARPRAAPQGRDRAPDGVCAAGSTGRARASRALGRSATGAPPRAPSGRAPGPGRRRRALAQDVLVRACSERSRATRALRCERLRWLGRASRSRYRSRARHLWPCGRPQGRGDARRPARTRAPRGGSRF